jgi:hypothetical protein
MIARELGSSGLKVSAVGMGCMYLSINERPSEGDAVRTLLAAIDAGVTLLDTADVYCIDHRDIGHNERLVANPASLRSASTGSTSTSSTPPIRPSPSPTASESSRACAPRARSRTSASPT